MPRECVFSLRVSRSGEVLSTSCSCHEIALFHWTPTEPGTSAHQLVARLEEQILFILLGEGQQFLDRPVLAENANRCWKPLMHE